MSNFAEGSTFIEVSGCWQEYMIKKEYLHAGYCIKQPYAAFALDFGTVFQCVCVELGL